MRIIIVAVLIALFADLSIILLPSIWLISKINEKTAQKMSQRIVAFIFNCILFLSGVKKDVIGIERIPKDRTVLYAMNHRGFFDVILALATVPGLAAFVSKKEIAKVPGLRLWMRNINCVFLDRENPREGIKAILKGIQNINNGTSMFICPEGTRNTGEELLPFKPGSLKIAEKSGCPVVPVAVTHAEKVFENQKPWLRPYQMTIEYGEPIYVHELSKETKAELLDHTKERVEEMWRRNR